MTENVLPASPRVEFHSKLARSTQYRPEIDGLRALAVLPVLLYHANVPGFSGGFVGVDIFYVISGYLITSIVTKEIAAGRFTFVAFYERRIRRIFPALFAVVGVTALVGAAVLAPQDLAAFGKSLIALTFFLSNVFFARIGGSGGYFGNDSDSYALLHTWSLSVEEQFYLLFPAMLIVLTRVAGKGTKRWLCVCAIASFAINIWATEYRPNIAFYILVTRAWELIIGSLLAMKALPLLEARASREIAGIIGLALIAWAVLLFTPETVFPGFAVLLPCVGAALIIYAGEDGSAFFKSVLSVKPLVFIGVISYSLYLWHWPVMVFSRKVWLGNLSAADTTFTIVLSLVLAFLSYKFIESPFRGGHSPINRRQVFAFGLTVSVLSAALGLALYSTKGFPGRYNDSTRSLIAANTDRKTDYQDVCSNWKVDVRSILDMTFCNIGRESNKFMFWGDSHVQQLYPLIKKIHDDGRLHDHAVVFATASGCTPVEHVNRREPGFHCDAFNHFAMLRAEQEDVSIVFIGFSAPTRGQSLCPWVDGRCAADVSEVERRRLVLAELSDEIQTLEARGKRVILSLPFPMFDRSIPDIQVRNALFHGLVSPAVAIETSSSIMRRDLASLAKVTGAEIFDPRESLCGRTDCVTEVDGVSIYRDRSHIAASQIGILKDNMESALQLALESSSEQFEAAHQPRSQSLH